MRERGIWPTKNERSLPPVLQWSLKEPFLTNTFEKGLFFLKKTRICHRIFIPIHADIIKVDMGSINITRVSCSKCIYELALPWLEWFT